MRFGLDLTTEERGTLNFVRRLTRLRKCHAALHRGGVEPLRISAETAIYRRFTADSNDAFIYLSRGAEGPSLGAPTRLHQCACCTRNQTNLQPPLHEARSLVGCCGRRLSIGKLHAPSYIMFYVFNLYRVLGRGGRPTAAPDRPRGRLTFDARPPQHGQQGSGYASGSGSGSGYGSGSGASNRAEEVIETDAFSGDDGVVAANEDAMDAGLAAEDMN